MRSPWTQYVLLELLLADLKDLKGVLVGSRQCFTRLLPLGHVLTLYLGAVVLCAVQGKKEHWCCSLFIYGALTSPVLSCCLGRLEGGACEVCIRRLSQLYR